MANHDKIINDLLRARPLGPNHPKKKLTYKKVRSGEKWCKKEYDYVDVDNHRSYATYNAYFVNGDDALVICCLQVPCERVEIIDVKKVRVSTKQTTAYCFGDYVSTLQ